MKKFFPKHTVIFIILIALLLVSACGPSEEELRATDTKIAEEIFATQTAAAPKATNTYTPSPTPTKTPKPTANRTATAAYRATSQAQYMYNLVQDLYDGGYLKSTRGQLYQMKDFSESWAQINWFQWWTYDIILNDFVVHTSITWESASKSANISTSGCGFVFWVDEEGEQYYVAFLALDGYANLYRMQNDRLIRVGRGYYGKIDYMKGSAELTVIAEGKKIQIFVNDEQVFSRDNQNVFEGNIAYTLLSGINTDFGTRCTFADTDIWSLEP